jgi:hypothetical protein
MVIASNSVSKTTLAGQVTLSVQDIDFTSPAAMQLILNDLMGEYMIASDNLAADDLLTAATSSGVWDLTVADLLKSVYDSAVDISNGRNWTPTHMFVSPDVWGNSDNLQAPLVAQCSHSSVQASQARTHSVAETQHHGTATHSACSW